MTRKRLVFMFVIALLGTSCTEAPKQSDEVLPQVDAVIDHLLHQYQIDRKSIATRTIKSGDGTFARRERRIAVAADFNTLEFNRALSSRVAEFDAAVIATEKLEDKSVTIHIKKDGLILESIVFRMKDKH